MIFSTKLSHHTSFTFPVSSHILWSKKMYAHILSDLAPAISCHFQSLGNPFTPPVNHTFLEIIMSVQHNFLLKPSQTESISGY